MVTEKADDLNESGDLPQPGTREGSEGEQGDRTDGPGNVTVDEPTQPALQPDEEQRTV